MGKRKGETDWEVSDPVGGLAAEEVIPEELKKMKDMDIREVDPMELSDILKIEIDEELSEDEKRKEFIRQIGNPYLYRQGEYIVKLKFADTEATLADRLKEYIEHVVFAGEGYGEI